MNICFFILAFSLFNFDYQEDSILQNIRHKYAEINSNLSQYKRTEETRADGVGEGGDIVSYLYRDSVKLIIETNYWENGKERTEYYYDNNEIIFIYDIKYKYKVPIYDSSFKIGDSRLEENRSYFNNRRMIKWIDEKKKIIPVNSTEFEKSEEIQLDYSLMLMKSALKSR
ncbi:hypothetical protein SAMN05518672_11223 [Chitinophaga sp. CF118]|uniref:hypothetical protein n=1 Tax=Chitinophaga sp. CF118 TaxID=1884367 RepID=UPI0008EA6EB5|nr:hypothetical protein [Chitinophaga sp. CF118]SFE91219.1 hypothetical protein SAMN05518672_11223 [Chitinophaga sp. CF118]